MFVLPLKSCIFIPLFRDYMNKLQPPVEREAILRKLFREMGTLNEPARTLNYVRYLSLPGYEPGVQNDAHEYLLQRLAKIYAVLMMTLCLGLIN